MHADLPTIVNHVQQDSAQIQFSGRLKPSVRFFSKISPNFCKIFEQRNRSTTYENEIYSFISALKKHASAC